MATRTFTRVETAELFSFETKGQTAEGILTRKGVAKFQDNSVGKYTLTDDDGTVRQILGTTMLDQILADIDDGTYVRITFEGVIKTANGMRMKQFTVETADD